MKFFNLIINEERYTLCDSKFDVSEGILVDSTFIRRDVYQNSIQSVVDDEIGFDIIIESNSKSIDKLKEYVINIIKCLSEVEDELIIQYPILKKKISNEFNWINANVKELKRTLNLLNFNETINKLTQENGLTVIYNLDSEIKKSALNYHFSQDVFDWSLYALIYVYHPQLSCAINIGYCGFSVDKETLINQNAITKENSKFKTFYNSMLSTGQLPLTITCGIYKSKLAMFLLEKQHIGEVNYSVWDKEFVEFVEKNDIDIL